MMKGKAWFTIFLIFCFARRKLTSAANPMFHACEPKACGGINITYPFWLSYDQQSYCGYPGFNLTCSTDDSMNPPPLVINLLGMEYYIRSIFYSNNSLQLTPVSSSSLEDTLNFTNNAAAVHPLGLSSTEANKEMYFFLNCSINAKEGWLLAEWTAPDCPRCSDSGGRCGYNDSDGSFMCICPDRVHKESCESSKRDLKIKVAVPASMGLLLTCLIVFAYYRWHKFHKKSLNTVEASLAKHGCFIPQRYKYSEIKRMTRSFSEKLGEGGCGAVYKGVLQDGQFVAVKMLNETKGNNSEEFINEVASISKTSHVNIVGLLGYCEGRIRAVVYEFMPNGSLEKFLSIDKPKLELSLGFEIALGIARGLEYLHRGCNMHIVHFDIKPHNILLDKDFRPKISDFGLAKLCQSQGSSISMKCARGTIGYIAPEIFSRDFGSVSSKSDVYSYGMMILDVVGERRNVNTAVDKYSTSEVYFPDYIYKHLDQYRVLHDAGVEISKAEELARKLIIVGLCCVQLSPQNRPSMSEVVEMLEGSKCLEIPPKAQVSFL